MPKVTSAEERALTVLLKEYERVCTDVRTIESQNDKIVGFGLTIVGAGAAFGLNQKLNEVFLVLPFLFVAVFIYAVLQYHNVFWLGGYKRALESKINKIAGATLLVWEALAEQKKRRVNFANLPLVSIYFLMLVGTSIYSVMHTFSNFGKLIAFVQAMLLLVLLGALMIAVRKAFSSFSVAHDITRTIFEDAGASID